MKKPWSGRFVKDTDEAVEQFTESVSIDHRLYRQDIRAGVAHAQMLQKCGLITLEDLTAVCEGLARIEQEIDAGSFEFRVPLEDVHMNIEAALIERVGDPGRRLHTARSRNDQVACDMRLWCREAAEGCRARLRECQRALVAKAREYSDAVMPGLTHLQHAQPVLLAHVLLAYVEMFARDDSRLADCGARLNVSPLGACALAGTSLPTDPQSTAEALQFDRCFSNSIDAVSDRDFVIEFAFDLSMIAMHLSRMAEDWVLWASAGLNFVDLDEAYCTGSSIMPQKKNPDVLELMRGRCGRVYGDLLALLTMLKGLPLAYNRDMQEDKAALFDAFDTVDRSLQLAADLVRNAAFKRDNMRNACRTGYLVAGRVPGPPRRALPRGPRRRRTRRPSGRIRRDPLEQAQPGPVARVLPRDRRGRLRRAGHRELRGQLPVARFLVAGRGGTTTGRMGGTPGGRSGVTDPP